MTKVNSYDEVKTIQDLEDTPCTACGERNLDHNLCPNCKWALECNDCCGCDIDKSTCQHDKYSESTYECIDHRDADCSQNCCDNCNEIMVHND